MSDINGVLAELDRLHAEATPGEWEVKGCGHPDHGVKNSCYKLRGGSDGKAISSMEDWGLVAALHNAFPTIRAEIDRLQDNPELDGTDAAHPAWWRGEEYAVERLCREINSILDGESLAGVCGEPWESTRQRIARLQAELADAIREAVAAERIRCAAISRHLYPNSKTSGEDAETAAEEIAKAIEGKP